MGRGLLCCLCSGSNDPYYFDAKDVGDVTQVIHAGVGGALDRIQDDILRNVVIEETRRVQGEGSNRGLAKRGDTLETSGMLAPSAVTSERESTLLSPVQGQKREIGSEFEEELQKIKDKYRSDDPMQSRESKDLNHFFRNLELQAKEVRELVRTASNTSNIRTIQDSPSLLERTPQILQRNKTTLSKQPKNFIPKERPLLVASRDVRDFKNLSKEEREEFTQMEPNPRPIQVSSFNGRKHNVPLDLQTFATQTEALSDSSDEEDVSDEELRKMRNVLQSDKFKKEKMKEQRSNWEDQDDSEEEKPVGIEVLAPARSDMKLPQMQSMTSFASPAMPVANLKSVKARNGRFPKLSIEEKHASSKSAQLSVAPSVQTHDTKFFNELFDTDSKDLTDLFHSDN